MPCHGCATKFGLFTAEKGCPACGFSFCNSCLKNKCAVPKLSDKVCKVCKSCFTLYSGNSKTSEENKMSQPGGPPDIFLKRMEALESPPKPPVTVYRAEPRLQMLMKGLNSTDLEIVTRLEKLRQDRQPAESVPSEEELARRLAVLRGQDVEQAKMPDYTHLASDSRSSEEQTRDLFQQCQEEVQLGKKYKSPDEEIARRLNQLRSNDQSFEKVDNQQGNGNASAITLDEMAQLLAQFEMEAGQSGKHVDLATLARCEKLRTRLTKEDDKKDEGFSSDEDEAKAASKIIAKVQAEVDLEKSLRINDAPDEEDDVMDSETDKEELPWCIICNEDAQVRCFGCDRDLYCKSCFQEGHRDEDMRDHAFEPYKKK